MIILKRIQEEIQDGATLSVKINEQGYAVATIRGTDINLSIMVMGNDVERAIDSLERKLIGEEGVMCWSIV